MRPAILLALALAACVPDDGTLPACTPGEDQTCNLDPEISSLHGRCEDDATCTCLDGYELDEATGRCR
jgi:hypothetical protein